MASENIKSRKREDYPFILDYRTRWNDNDMYNHLNNSVYNFLFDSAVNAYLITHCGLDPATAPITPLVVSTHTDYLSPIAYPAVAEVGVRVDALGRSSVTYEVALFARGTGTGTDSNPDTDPNPDPNPICAVGRFVHVFVDRASRAPVPISPAVRTALLLLAIHRHRAGLSKL